ncbi:MAG: VOC family protein, partial [Cellvibrionaceae bacterium]|nr:VOC family protein [Cellvibrionaceae bacterium]
RRPDAAPRRWPEAGVATRFVRASVADLQKSRRFFVEALGLQEAAELQLHSPEHEALWGLAGAECDSLLLWAGDYLIELVQYRQPSGKPLPADSRISDQGLLNIALGFRSRSALDQVFRRCEQMGYRANSRPVSFGSWAVTYVNDDQGFSVELLFVRPWFDWFMGFVPRKRG